MSTSYDGGNAGSFGKVVLAYTRDCTVTHSITLDLGEQRDEPAQKTGKLHFFPGMKPLQRCHDR
jgi:hypothetical protein